MDLPWAPPEAPPGTAGGIGGRLRTLRLRRAAWRARPGRRGAWSLRRRILVVLGAVLVVGLGVADGVTYHTLRSYLLNREDQQLDALAHGGLNRVLRDGGLAPGGFFPSGVLGGNSQAFIELRDTSGNVIGSALQAHRLDQSALPPPQLPAQLPAPPASAANGGDAAVYLTAPSTGSGQAPYRVRVGYLSPDIGLLGGQTVILVVATPLSDMVATLHKLVWTELGVSLAAVALAVAGGAWLVRVGLRPLEDMADTADEIAAGRLDRRVDAEDPATEVGRLGSALNSMLGRIEVAFSEKEVSEDRLRRFIADASHELRTPLTSIRGYAELFRRGADRRPEDLAKAMNRIEAEATRMGFLVEDLLLLARLDQGRPLEKDPVDMRTVVADAVDAARAVEPDRVVTCDLAAGAVVEGDRHRLRQVADNLLANVRFHTPEGAPAEVHLGVEADQVVLRVDDHGPGLGPEAERVFERFYRADPSRSQDTGGAGLGLSIVQAIATAHGGTVAAANRPDGTGARFEVRLPLASAGGAAGGAGPEEETDVALHDVFGAGAAAGSGPGGAAAHRPGPNRPSPDGADTNGAPRIGSGRSQG